MNKKPIVSIIVSSYERPAHLIRCLHSIAAQKHVQGSYEVIVADDGSRDETEQCVRNFALTADFPVRMTTHEHDGFELSRCRNEGALLADSDYLLFTDGDCLLPEDFLSVHLRGRRHDFVMAGHCYRLEESATKNISAANIRVGLGIFNVTRHEKRRAFWKRLRAKAYEFLGVSMRPRVSGSCIGTWRSDFFAVNGFDETFVGWGLEDTDYQLRLESIGIRSRWTKASVYHMWHRKDPTCARNSRGTDNYRYFHRPGPKLSRCLSGLKQRTRSEFRCYRFDELPLSPSSTDSPEVKIALEA